MNMTQIYLNNPNSNENSQNSESTSSLDTEEFYRTILKLRKIVDKGRLHELLNTGKGNLSNFDNNLSRIVHLLMNKITNIDQNVSKMILERIMLENVTKDIRRACPTLLHCINTEPTDIFANSLDQLNPNLENKCI